MAVEDLVKLIDAVAKLLGVLVWPGLIAYVLVKFAPAMSEFFASLGELTFKGAGFEATAKRKQAEAAAALAAAAATRPDADSSPGGSSRSAREAAEVVAEVVTPRTIRKASKATVLWVDDEPENNFYERQSLEAIGVTFVLARSTEEAIAMRNSHRFDAIISDMGRPPDARAGYTLLNRLRADGDQTPYVIYAGSNAPEHKAEARRSGALGCTNRASELFEYVLSALRIAA